MKFKLDPKVIEKYPNLYFYIPVIKGFNNSGEDMEVKVRIQNMHSEVIEVLRNRFHTVEELMENENTKAFLELFKSFGANNRTLPSHVAMALRIVEDSPAKPSGTVPSINNVVDLYNSQSLKFFTPFGGEDLEQVYGDLVLKLAEGNETYYGIGSPENKKQNKSPKTGEIIWIDDLDVTCRALNWRQSDRTKITPDSKVGYFIMDGVRVEDKENIKNAADELLKDLVGMLGGEVVVLYLDKDNLEAEYNFETKALTEDEKVKHQQKLEVEVSNKKQESREEKKYIFPWASSASKIQQQLLEAVKTKYGKELRLDEINLDTPADESHGDYASNIAMSLAKELGKNPREIATELSQLLNVDGQWSNEIAGPGFINFKIDNNSLKENLKKIAKNEPTQIIDQSKKKRIMIEMGDPNTHKMPHIGHLFSYVAGNALSNILEASGHELFRVYYGGDVGMHVAKALYGWIQNGRPKPEDMFERVKVLQEAYQKGSALYEEEEHKAKIQQINKDIYDENSEIQTDWKETRQWSLDYYLEFEKLLGINLDKHYPESIVWKEGLKIVQDNIGKIFEESEGAVIFPGEKFGLHNRVFITKQGTPTYEAKDMGLSVIKKRDWDYDLAIIPTATEQNEYFKVVIEAINQTFPELKDKVMHIGFGMVNLKSGKMSSRSGNILSAPELVDTVIATIKEKLTEREDMSEQEKNLIAKNVGLGAIKYSFLKVGLSKNRSFDIEESISAEGDSGPYIMYAFVRTQSILKQESANVDIDLTNSLGTEEEQSLIRHLNKYDETVLSAGMNYAPNVIVNYLYNLAQKFNNFYAKHQILNTESETDKQARLLLTQATANILQKGLKLLGIDTVEKM